MRSSKRLSVRTFLAVVIAFPAALVKEFLRKAVTGGRQDLRFFEEVLVNSLGYLNRSRFHLYCLYGTHYLLMVAVNVVALFYVRQLRIRKIRGPNFTGHWLGPTKPKNVLLYFHGGCYLFGHSLQYLPAMNQMIQISKKEGASYGILSVDYPLAPEYPYPAQLNAARAALEWLHKEGFSMSQLHLGGDSAGANLAIALTLSLMKEKAPLPRSVVAISPWVNIHSLAKSVEKNRGCDFITKSQAHDAFPGCAVLPLLCQSFHYPLIREILQVGKEFFCAGHSAEDPLISPLYADLSGFPELLVSYGGKEAFVDDIKDFLRRCRQAKVRVEEVNHPSMYHIYPVLVPCFRSKMAQEGLESIISFMISRAAKDQNQIR